MRRLDSRGAIRFVDATTSDLEACPIDRRALLARFHAQEGERLLSGAAAFAAMWRVIPLLRPLGLAARSPSVLRLLEAVYLAFLKVRPALKRAARSVAMTALIELVLRELSIWKICLRGTAHAVSVSRTVSKLRSRSRASIRQISSSLMSR